MATYETVIRLQLDNKEAVRRLGALTVETKRFQREAREMNARLAKQAVVSKEDANALGVLEASIRRNQAEMRELRNEVSGTTAAGLRFRDKMANASTQALGAFGLAAGGVTTAVLALSRAVSGAVDIIADFEAGQSRLQAITRATDAEMKLLSDQAKELGATTAFTASQVLELQTELAKLGFTTSEINASTAGVLELAAASGTDLATAASVAAETLNGFGLTAEDTQRVVDVMARSFTTSALDMEKFSNSMANVAPAAAAVGLSVEQTTAQLAKLVDSGIDASKAGTDLRQIYIELAKRGITWKEAQDQILGSQNRLTTAVDLFDKRAANSALIIAQQAGEIADLTEAYENAAGAARDMAQAQLDNLRGDQLILTSAWEGFVLSVEDGSGVISRAMRNVTTELTDLLTALRGLNEAGSFSEAVLIAISQALPAEAGAALRAMATAVYGAKDATEELGGSVEELQAEYDRLTEYIEAYIAEGKKEIANDLLKERAMVAAKLSTLEHAKATEAATDATNKNSDAEEENAKKKTKQAAIVRVLTDELRAYLKAVDDINKGVGIGQMDTVNNTFAAQDPNFTGPTQGPQELTPESALLGPGVTIDQLDAETLAYVNSRDTMAQADEDFSERSIAALATYSQAVGESLAKALQDSEEASEAFLSVTLQAVRSAVRLWLAALFAQEVGTKSFAGLATFAALSTLVETAFAAAQNSIQGFADGGMIQGGQKIRRSNGDNVLITARVGEVIFNEEQQRNLEAMLGPGVWRALGIPGFATGGPVQNSGYVLSKRRTGIAAPRPSSDTVVSSRLAGVTEQLANTPIFVSWAEGQRVGRRATVTEGNASL